MSNARSNSRDSDSRRVGSSPLRMDADAPDAAKDRVKTVIEETYAIEPVTGKEEGNDQG